jgi:hypothetical protein
VRVLGARARDLTATSPVPAQRAEPLTPRDAPGMSSTRGPAPGGARPGPERFLGPCPVVCLCGGVGWCSVMWVVLGSPSRCVSIWWVLSVGFGVRLVARSVVLSLVVAAGPARQFGSVHPGVVAGEGPVRPLITLSPTLGAGRETRRPTASAQRGASGGLCAGRRAGSGGLFGGVFRAESAGARWADAPAWACRVPLLLVAWGRSHVLRHHPAGAVSRPPASSAGRLSALRSA